MLLELRPRLRLPQKHAILKLEPAESEMLNRSILANLVKMLLELRFRLRLPQKLAILKAGA